MNPALSKAFQRLEREKQALLSAVASECAEAMSRRPEPGCWSRAEVLDHLAKVEEACVNSVQANLKHSRPVRLQHRLKALMVNGVMRTPLRVKVPASAKGVLPAAAADVGVVREQWSEVRRRLAELLNRLPPEKMRCGVFRHPVAGWMTIFGALAFLSAHLQHHRYQLNRLKRATAEI